MENVLDAAELLRSALGLDGSNSASALHQLESLLKDQAIGDSEDDAPDSDPDASASVTAIASAGTVSWRAIRMLSGEGEDEDER